MCIYFQLEYSHSSTLSTLYGHNLNSEDQSNIQNKLHWQVQILENIEYKYNYCRILNITLHYKYYTKDILLFLSSENILIHTQYNSLRYNLNNADRNRGCILCTPFHLKICHRHMEFFQLKRIWCRLEW